MFQTNIILLYVEKKLMKYTGIMMGKVFTFIKKS